MAQRQRQSLSQPCSQPVDLLALHQANPARFPFLLESTSGVNAYGGYDILFALPGASLTLQDGRLQGVGADAPTPDFLQALNRWHQREANSQPNPYNLPFCGGWFLYLGYELAQQIEPCLNLPPARQHLPTALAVRCPAALVRERRSRRVYAVAETSTLMDELLRELDNAPEYIPATLPHVSVTEDDPKHYLRHIQAVQDYILAGDIFQVNLSREWRARLADPVAPHALYAALRQANPAPFAGLMCWQDTAVISSSPERLLSLRNGVAQTRPIAGTRPRTGSDTQAGQALLTHPKERAEHVMLIDLERNDLGRICEYGSVEVNELMALESYSHVHHIVSNVRGRLRPGVGPGDALRAVFPGGTITGCPKVRCMEIIAELEGQGRGAYTGAMGYLGRDGRLDSNILIRTLVHHGQDLWLRAGGGIVADSNPEKELDETRAKARAMLLSLGIST